MRLLMATLIDADGPEAEPVTLEVVAGVVSLTLADGMVLEFDETELELELVEAQLERDRRAA